MWSTAYDASQQASRTTAAKSAVDQALQSYGVSCDVDATCSVQYVACDTGECVEVTVTYDWAADPLVPDLPLVPTPGELTQTASVRVS